jgi:alkylation response protein AidB-like acyl-CoA dehydrogenase
VSEYDALCANEPELAKLRTSIREYLVADRAEFGWQSAVDSWLGNWDEEFSARLGDAGFVGMTIPQEYGGHGLGHLHRYVVTEELLAVGAPVAAHWIADRQVAPGLLAYGNEEQRQRLLPRIAAGRYFSAIGMSEPGAGSDLAAVSSKAVRAAGDDGWLLNGRKVWTSGAHHAHQAVVLARTSPLDPEHRHAGFSQFIVLLDSPGVTIDPIVLMSGEHHFNEIVFEDVFVPDANVLGEIGAGWHQVTSELSFERSGPERILSTAPLITAAVRVLADRAEEVDDRTAAAIGDLLARLISLRQLSVSVARALTEGKDAANQAALVKDLGTMFEQDSVELVADLLEFADAADPPDWGLRAMLATARVHKPMFTLRGGTNEVLRGVVARGMGLR